MGTTKYRLWNKRGWQSDGSIRKRESVSGNWESTAIVEFKGMQNRFLRHNDIAKFVQYLNYVSCNNMALVWICRGTMVDDVSWVCEKILNDELDGSFFNVCNEFAANSYLKAKPLRDLEKLWESIGRGKRVKDSYNTVKFRHFITKKSNQSVLKKGIKKLVVVTIDGEVSRRNGSGIELICLSECRECKSAFQQFVGRFVRAERRRNFLTTKTKNSRIHRTRDL